MRRAAVAPLVVAALAACAAPLTLGESGAVGWRAIELRTSERVATQPGYKGDGRAKDYRYIVELTERRGVGIEFREVESMLLVGAGFRPTMTTRSLNLRLLPTGHLRVAMTDSV